MENKQEYLRKLDSALNDLRPHLAEDGGNIELVDITEDLKVQVKWLGNCELCSMSEMTMKAGVEQVLRQQFPEITGVEAVNGL